MATETQMQLLDQVAENQQRQLFEDQSSVPTLQRRAKPRPVAGRTVTLQEAIRSGADRAIYIYDVLFCDGKDRLKRELLSYWRTNLPKWIDPSPDRDFDHAEAAEIQSLLRELDAADIDLDVYSLWMGCRILAEMDLSN